MPRVLISKRDVDVLKAIEDLTVFTFGGIKRKLGIHPETLSRILYRLEAEGFLEKEFEGYVVTSKIEEFSSLHPHMTNGTFVSLLQTLLPLNSPIQHTILDLKGKWFGVLRWLGYSEKEDGITLNWITDDGRIQVDANFSARANFPRIYLTNHRSTKKKV